MSGEAVSLLSESFKESVINWFKSNEITDLLEAGQLPKHELDEKTNTTYTLTEAKIKHSHLGIELDELAPYKYTLGDLEDTRVSTRWEDFERIEDKEGFLAKLKDHKPNEDLYDDYVYFKGEVLLTKDPTKEIAKWDLSFFLRDNGAEDSVEFHENYPDSPVLSEKFIRKKFVMPILRDDLGWISESESESNDESESESDEGSEGEEDSKRRTW
jgi:hypothetical protein